MPKRTPTALFVILWSRLYFFYAFRYDGRSFYFMCLNGTACLVLRLSCGYCQHTVSIYAKSFMVAPFNILLFQAQPQHCVTLFPGRHEQRSSLLASDKKLKTYQSRNAIKVQFGKPISFTRLIHRNISGRLLTGAEMTQRWVYHEKYTQHEWQLAGSLALAAQPAGSLTEYPFQAAQLLWVSFRKSVSLCLFQEVRLIWKGLDCLCKFG